MQKKRVFLDNSEIEASNYLRNNGKGFVAISNNGSATSIHPYHGAFSQRDVFLGGYMILESHNKNFKDREDALKAISYSKNKDEIKKILEKYKIEDIYFLGGEIFAIIPEEAGLKRIFKNSNFSIYKNINYSYEY